MIMTKYCRCGCGEEIVIKSHHKRYGIPDYCWGHNASISINSPESLKKRSKRMKENNPMKDLIIAKKNALKRKGARRTKKQKENIGIGVREAMKNPEVKEKLKKPKTEEHKRKLSEAVKELWCDSKYREKNTGKNSYLYKDGKTLRKYYCIDCGKELKNIEAKRCSKCSNREIRNRPEVRKLHSKIMKRVTKQRWQDGIFDGVFRSPTNPEKEIMKVLKKSKLDYIFQFRPKDFSMIYDFYIPKMNLLIEFDGVYWHSLPEVKERDMKKTGYADKNNYILLRFNENNLINFQDAISKKFNNIVIKENKDEIIYVSHT